jgi:FtsP/CotA-like multicopper oxidase with cupredoxin domain
VEGAALASASQAPGSRLAMEHPRTQPQQARSTEQQKRIQKHNGEHPEEHGEQEVRRSGDEVFVKLNVEYALNKIRRITANGKSESDTVKLRSYNGKLVGPTIKVRPGDTLNITLHNRLPPDAPSHPDDHHGLHGFNTTNLHFHGLHVSPAGNSDNVMLELKPGQSFQYEVKIPHDHPAGTYFYHAHKHGSAAVQIGSGMVGALIVRGGIDEIDEIDDAQERILVIQQIPYTLLDDPYVPGQKANMVEDFFTQFVPGSWAALGRHFTINGDVVPTFKMKPGEVERWRLIHAGLEEGLKLRLVRRQGNTEIPVPQFQIAHDGITTGRLDQVDESELFPGYRVDVLVRASDAKGNPLPEGTYFLVNTLDTSPITRVLARVEVDGKPDKMKLPSEAELKKHVPFKPIEKGELTGKQTAIMTITLTDPPQFMINGKVYDHHAPPRKLPLGGVEEWFVKSENFDHPFHIHVNPFQLELNGKVIWKDTLQVNSGQEFKLRTRYERYVGLFMMHCHISAHADLGMAEQMEVVVPAEKHGGGPHH